MGAILWAPTRSLARARSHHAERITRSGIPRENLALDFRRRSCGFLGTVGYRTSPNIWRIIEEGFYPHDRSNFTPREAADNQFNENALFIIQDAIPPEDLAHLRPFTVAKDAWRHVVSLYR